MTSAPPAPRVLAKKKKSRPSIASRIRKPTPTFGHVAICIYGRGGVGKTSLLGTMPGKGLVLDVPTVEGGTLVLHNHADRIDVIDCLQWADFDDVWKYLRDVEHDYKWVAIDTLTAAQKLGIRKTMNERDLSADPHQISQQDWGKIGQLNAELYYRFRQLPLHLILLAQERLKGTGEDAALEYQPDVSPASLTALIPPMHIVGRLYTREVSDTKGKRSIERRLRVGTHSSTVTKARTVPERQLPPVLKNPSLAIMLRYILGVEGAPAPEEVFEDPSSLEIE